MRKGLVIILAVAIIGSLGVYAKAHDSADTTTVQRTQTTAQPTPISNTTQQNTDNPAASASQTSYKDGTYTGQTANTIYGPVQAQAVISGGKIIDINFLKMPDDQGHTREVTTYSEPLLEQQTLKKQSSQVDFISGATQTSEGYEQSLQAALDQAA